MRNAFVGKDAVRAGEQPVDHIPFVNLMTVRYMRIHHNVEKNEDSYTLYLVYDKDDEQAVFTGGLMQCRETAKNLTERLK